MGREVPEVYPEEVDVVVAALKPDLGFLAAWRELLQGCHLIVVQGSPFVEAIRVPEGFGEVDVYTTADIAKLLGPELAKSLDFSGYGCRSFGYLVARRRYVFTVEGDCTPAVNRAGFVVNPVVEHLSNLKKPATPFFFNTLYDPYQEGADFVRGYPFSLREGVPTAVSQGLWMVAPKNGETARYVDAVITIPKNVLFTPSGINLAFDRSKIGPAMFEPLQLGVWGGHCCKVICDHFGLGVKSGLPYVCRNDQNAQNEVDPEGASGKASMEVVARFFQTAKFSSNSLDVEACYLELAQQAKSELSAVDPIFGQIALSMQAWIQAWRKLGSSG